MCGHFGHSARRGQWAKDLGGESQDQEEQKLCWAVNNVYTFSMAFLITKPSSSHPWWRLCTRAVPFEEIPVAHTGFPKHIPVGFLKGTQSPSSEFQRDTACPPSQTVWSGDTLRPVLRSRDVPRQKQNNRMAPDQTRFFLQRPKTEFHNDNERQRIYNTCAAYEVNTSESSKVRHGHAFLQRSLWVKARLQSWSWWAEAGQFGAAPVVGVKLPVTYVSLGPLRFID